MISSWQMTETIAYPELVMLIAAVIGVVVTLVNLYDALRKMNYDDALHVLKPNAWDEPNSISARMMTRSSLIAIMIQLFFLGASIYLVTQLPSNPLEPVPLPGIVMFSVIAAIQLMTIIGSLWDVHDRRTMHKQLVERALEYGNGPKWGRRSTDRDTVTEQRG